MVGEHQCSSAKVLADLILSIPWQQVGEFSIYYLLFTRREYYFDQAIMDAGNKPKTVGEDPSQPDLPPPTYLTLADWLAPHPKSVAKALVVANESVGWEEALDVSVGVDELGEKTENDVKAMLGAYADSLTPIYLLVARKKEEVTVVYGWKPCRPILASGARYAGLLGDRRVTSGGTEVPPSLVITKTNATDQLNAFNRVTVRAPTLEAVETAFEADAETGLVGPLEDPAEEITSWRAIPVHPKLAGLFVGGLSFRKAIALYGRLVKVVPENLHHKLNWLGRFLRVAATGVGEISSLGHDWNRKNPHEEDSLMDWYAVLCEQYAPRMQASPWQPPRPANPPTPGETPRASSEPESTREPYKRAYTQAELGRLYSWCGVEPMESGDMTADQLPTFWKEFEKQRGKFHSARTHIEGWFDHNWPAQAPSYQRFISTALVKHMVTLDLDGQDARLTFGKRNDGFSVFSVYPLDDNEDPGARRDRAMAYEDTMDNHRPAEREQMGQLSQCNAPIPDSRTEMWKWVQYFVAAVETIFGGDCPLIRYLESYKSTINSNVGFARFGRNEWKAYFWKYHCAVRMYFSPGGDDDSRVRPFMDFLNRVRQGQPITWVEVPSEVWGTHTQTKAAGGQIGASGLGGGGRRSQGDDQGEARSMSKQVASEWSKAVSPMVKKASDAVKAAGKDWSMKLLYPKGCKEAFGGALNIVKPNNMQKREPCPRLFTYGKCRTGRCSDSHNLEREPTAGQKKHFVDWVEKRCAEIVADPGKA